MTDLRTAAQQALEALWHGVKRLNHRGGTVECLPLHDAITTLRAALAQPQEPVPDRLEQLRAFCKWERVNSPHPEGLPHVAEWAVMEIDRLRVEKAQPVQARVKRSQDWHDGVIEGHLREREYWLAQQAQPVQDTDCHAQGICQRTGYSIK